MRKNSFSPIARRFSARHINDKWGGVILYSNIKYFLVVAVALCFLCSCDDFPMDVPQDFHNISDYDVTVSMQGKEFVVKSGETKQVEAEIAGMDDTAPEARLLNNDYPRAAMTRKVIDRRHADFVINNTQSISYTIINESPYSVYVRNNYMGKRCEYEEDGKTVKGVYIPGLTTLTVDIYNNCLDFYAVYKAENYTAPEKEDGETDIAFSERMRRYEMEKKLEDTTAQILVERDSCTLKIN